MTSRTAPLTSLAARIHTNTVSNRQQATPISEASARTIDNARRSLIARSTDTEIAPPPPNLDMVTQETEIPAGEWPIELHQVTVTFTDILPARRARISTLLRSCFGVAARLQATPDPHTWSFELKLPHTRCGFDYVEALPDAVIAFGGAAMVRIQGLYPAGLFIFDKMADGSMSFKRCGDRDAAGCKPPPPR